MQGYKDHPPLAPRLIGYDPVVDLPADHVAYMVDQVVDMFVVPSPKPVSAGQPERDPRVRFKVCLYSMVTGVHSSRRMAQNCHENLPYLLLVRDERPCHTSLADTRRSEEVLLKALFRRLGELALQLGMPYLGRIAIDSSKFRTPVSKDSIVAAKDMEKLAAAFEEILRQVEATDAREDLEGPAVHTQTGVSQTHMREVLRAIGKGTQKELKLSPRMVERVKDGVETLKAAQAEKVSHVSLTDPDARMMLVGSKKRLEMGYLFEAVTDGGNLVVAQTGNHASDGGRLLELVELAKEADPVAVTQVVADTGYFNGGQVKELLDAGLDVVVPDQATSRELRGKPDEVSAIEFTKVDGKNAYVCPEGNELKMQSHFDRDGQRFTIYRAERECLDCPLAGQCLKQKTAKRRGLTVGEFRDELKDYSAKFREPEVRKTYYSRGPDIETVFAVFGVLFGFNGWHVKGSQGIASEGALLSCGYQLKKIHGYLKKKGKTLAGAMG